MSRPTEEGPRPLILNLHPRVSRWLQFQADRLFGGDVEWALHELLQIPMSMSEKPDDLWAGIETHRVILDPEAQASRRRVYRPQIGEGGAPPN